MSVIDQSRSVEAPARLRARWMLSLAAIVFWLLVWQVLAAVLQQDLLLVSPVAVAVRLAELVPTPELWDAVIRTTTRIVWGFVAAVVIGAALALASAWSLVVRVLVAPVISAVRATPVVSFIILVLIWTDSASLATVVSFLMTVPIIHANVLTGLDARDRLLTEMADVFGVPLVQRVWSVELPQLLPYLVAGARSGVGLAWKSGVAAEVIGLPVGTIGEQLYQAKIMLSSADLFAWTAVIVILAVATERAFIWLLGRCGPAR